MAELEFPLVFDQCPNCGSERRIVEILLEKEREQGRINKDAKATVMIQNTAIVDPTRAGMALTIPVLLTFYDICADCGTLYCVLAQLQKAMPQMAPGKQPPGFLFPPGNPRGN